MSVLDLARRSRDAQRADDSRFSELRTVSTQLLGLPFRALSAVRNARAFHPDGVSFSGSLERLLPEQYGIPLRSCEVTVRISKGIGIPAGLPDVAGIAVRVPPFEAGAAPWDLLLAGAATGVVGRMVPWPSGLPDVTAKTIREGWLHTGDIGVLDEDGYLVLVDRLKDMIIRGGENIAPSEIEHVLQSHPDVLEVAVVGEAHPVYGEVPVAHVVARAGRFISVDELDAHCARSLAKFKRPTRTVVHDALPKNSVGKIVKKELGT